MIKRSSLPGLLLAAVLVAFTALYATNAWVVDDAYITLRTVDNVLRGYGATWNVGERVQVYTHPLWMLLQIPFVALGGGAFHTVLAVSFGCVLAAFAASFRAFRDRDPALRTAALVLAVVASKSVVDYASSGLEQPLGYLWIALFLAAQRRSSEASPRRLAALVTIASLACVTRQDTFILYLPALAVEAHRTRGRGRVKAILTGLAPVVLWHGFSLVYYGSLVPNTAYAKLLGPALGVGVQTMWGLRYAALSFAHDPASLVIVMASVWIALRNRDRVRFALLAGAASYLAYAIGFAAVSTHMLGRFIALPVFVAALVLCDALPGRRAVAIASALSAGAVVVHPTSALYAGSRWYTRASTWQVEVLDPRIVAAPYWIDAKQYTLREHADLLSQIPGMPVPRHDWYLDGLAFRDAKEPLQVGGAFFSSPIGYFGYAAGPQKIVVDLVALSDPLRARLPACGAVHEERPIRPGHFLRPLPEGYVASLLSGENRIRDPHLHDFYEMQRRVLRDPLWSRARLEAIVALNVGRHRHLLDAYVRDHAETFRYDACVTAVRAAAHRYEHAP
ncbi:Hypothetical protein A7982_01778 [Minicystis rosea]|nr:Hypothetical protein A7982_01778 [Minicystis rosea]